MNPRLDIDALPGGVANSLGGISQAVIETDDCSTDEFIVAIPPGWQCRKLKDNARDVTLYTPDNTINMSLGRNQGMTSCSIIPVCTSRLHSLSAQFETTLYLNPLVGTYEYAGDFLADPTQKVTIISPQEPVSEHLLGISGILNSFELR